MKKIINTAPMAVITTLHTPPTLSLTLKVASGTMTQAQDIAQNLWSPDRTINAMVIEPMFSAYDPDTNERIDADPVLKWYVTEGETTSEITSTTPSSTYYRVDVPPAGSDIKAGSLVVRKNVSYNSPVTIRCTATYQGKTEEDTMVLTTENKPEVFYLLDIKSPAIVKYHPLSDANSQKSFQAFVQHGETPLAWSEVVGKSINAVDLGSLSWNKSGETFYATLSTKAKTNGGAALAGYTQDQTLADDKTISTSTGNIRIKDAAYSTAAELKAALDGKVLFYELATKTVQEDFLTAMRKMTGFFWYLDGQLITKDTFGYVSGQGMETLVLDAEYIDGGIVSVQLAVPTFTDNVVTMPTTPNAPYAQRQLVWEWPNVEVLAIARGGNAVHQFTASKTFDSVVKVDGQDLNNATKRNTYIRSQWYLHRTDANQDSRIYEIDGNVLYGSTVNIPGSALLMTGNVNVEVNTEIYLLGALRPTINQATGEYIRNASTGEIVFTREETQVQNTAPATIIITKKSDLTTLLTIKIASGTLTQAQDLAKLIWVPDRTLQVMKLEPMFSAVNPETKENVDLNPMYQWYANGALITSTNPSSDYYLETVTGAASGTLTGNLIVRKNVNYNQTVVIKCKATYTDNLRVTTYTREDEITLSTENMPDALFMVDLNVEDVIKYRPLTDSNSQKTIKAFVQYGDEFVTTGLYYFWYVNDTPITEDMVGYVSGLGTDTLVVDMEFFDNDIISLRISSVPDEPNLNAYAQCLIIWEYDDVEVLPVARGGSGIRVNSGEKVFDPVVHVNGKDISDEKFKKYIRLKWFTHATDESQDSRTDYGYGARVTIPSADLRKTGNVNVEVGADLYVLGVAGPVIGYDSYQIVNGELIGVGEPKMVVDETTGKVVVSNS